MLTILNQQFEEDFTTRETLFMFFKADKQIETGCWMLDCIFKSKIIDSEEIRPIISINHIYTDCDKYEDLIGESNLGKSFEYCKSREDYMYFYGQEPFQNYSIKIVEIKDRRAHIICTGKATLDSDAKPMITADFQWDCWLPIIEDAEDWEKFGL